MVLIMYVGRLGNRGTDPARRGGIGEDVGDRRSPARRKVPKSAKNNEIEEIPDSRGVWGHEGLGETPAIDPHRPPNHGFTTT